MIKNQKSNYKFDSRKKFREQQTAENQGVAFRTKWTGILDRLGKMDRTGGVREWRGFGGAISGIPRDAKLPEIEPKPRALDFN